MSLSEAAILAAILLFGLAAFHLALALGAPLGAYAWGGQVEGAVTQRLRRGSGLLCPVIAAMAVVVLMRGGLVFPDEAPGMLLPVWGIFTFLVLQASGALRSASAPERRFMTPLYVVALALVGYLGFSGQAGF